MGRIRGQSTSMLGVDGEVETVLEDDTTTAVVAELVRVDEAVGGAMSQRRPVYPFKQTHSYDPAVSEHTALEGEQLCVPDLHSSTFR